MRTGFLSMLVTSVLLGGGMPETSPVRTATAGAYFTRAQGNHALSTNPANLGYYGRPLVFDSMEEGKPDGLNLEEKAAVTANVVSSKEYYSVQLMASSNRSLVRKARKVFLDRFGRAIPSAIIRADTIYKFRVGNFTERDSAEVFRDSLVARGYSDAWIVTDDHPLVEPDQVPYFTMTLTGVHLDARNNAIYPDWINQQLFGGLDLRDQGKKDDFLSVFSTDVWNLNLMAGMNSLSFAVGNYGMSIIEPKVVSTLNLPTAVMDVLFRGVRFDQPQDLSDLSLDLLAAAPVSLAYGRQLAFPKLTNMVDRLYVGAGVNLLVGLKDVHLVSDHLGILTTPDSILIEGRTRVVTNADPESPRAPALGAGFSMDLGVAADINPELSVSLAWKDLFGSITWPDRHTTVNEFSIRLSSEEIEYISADYDEQVESLKQRYNQSDTSYASGSSRTVYPAQFILGASCQVLQDLTIDASFSHYRDNDYLGNAAPQLSLGFEYAPTPVFPMYAGIGVGGIHGFKWGVGFALNLGALEWTLGFGQEGGMFNAARGVSLSTEFRLLFGPTSQPR